MQDLEKLSLYLGDRKTVTADDITLIVIASKDSATWDLVDAVADRKPALALQVLNQLLFQGESGVAMIIALENRFRELSLFRDCLDTRVLRAESYGRGTNLIWSQQPAVEALFAGMSPDPRTIHAFRAGLLVEQAKKYSASELNDRLDWLLETHHQLVTTGLPPNILMELLVVRMCGKPKR